MPKTRRRYLCLLLASIVLVLVGVGIAWILWPRPGITAANAAKIQDGMTSAEVEAIFGGPAGDYRTPGGPSHDFAYHFMHPLGSKRTEWHGDEGLALVAFDSQGRVVAFLFLEPSHAQESLLTKLRRWFGL